MLLFKDHADIMQAGDEAASVNFAAARCSGLIDSWPGSCVAPFGISASSDAGVEFFRVLTSREVTEAGQSLARDVAVEAPKIRFVVGHLLAPFVAGFLEYLDTVDFVVVKAGWQVAFW